MVFVWRTNFDITDKELDKVAPSIEKQSNTRPNVNIAAPTKSNSVLKEQSQMQNKLDTLSLNGNKENYSTNERIGSSKVTIVFKQHITTLGVATLKDQKIGPSPQVRSCKVAFSHIQN